MIKELSASELRELMPTLESGMLPKMEACLRAVEGGLTRATVTDGRVPHALLLEIFTNAGIGTMVTQDGLIRLGSRVFSAADGHPPARDRQRRVRPAAPAAAAGGRQDRSEGGTSVTAEAVAVTQALSGPPTGGSAAVLEHYQQSVMNTFGTPKRVFVRGEGCYVWDADGRRHLDLLSGLAVTALGHAHPTVLSAITGQIATLGHVSNFFATPAQVALAERLDRDGGRTRRGEGLLHQLRHRGQRGRVQDHPGDRPYQDHRDRGSLPRSVDGCVGDHPQPQVPGAVRPAAGRGDLRPVR